MSIADEALGPAVWKVPPYSFSSLGKLKRRVYCLRNGDKLRMFFLGMLAMDTSLSPEDKDGFYQWLQSADWARFLAGLYDMASWQKGVDKEEDPINSVLYGSEYSHLFRCYQMGIKPEQTGLI